MEPDDVTDSGKCYTFKCLGCDGLAQSTRRHAFTCSGRCRVRWMRNKAMREAMAGMGIGPGLEFEMWAYAQMSAIKALCPDAITDELKTTNGRRFERELIRINTSPVVIGAYNTLLLDSIK